MASEATALTRPVSRREFLSLGSLSAMAAVLGGCAANQTALDSAARTAAIDLDGEPVAKVAARVGPSVVQVNVEAIQTNPYGYQGRESTPFAPQRRGGLGRTQSQEGQQGVASGVIYREDGCIVTNNHVVQDVSEVNVALADGNTETAEIVGTDSFTDIAVVRVKRDDLPAASFGDSSKLTPGQLAVAIGSPAGFQSTVTLGVISGLGREVSAEYTGGQQEDSLVDLIQTDAAISPGSSGGALANRAGEVVGINVAYLPAKTGAESIGFAIPSNTASSVADQLIADGRAVHPYLGVSLTDLTSEISRRFGRGLDSGAIVVEVDPSGPAARAGISSGDIITAVGFTQVENSGDLLGALRRYGPGDTVQLSVVRDGQTRQVRVRLGERGGTP